MLLRDIIQASATEPELIGVLCRNLSNILANFLANINLSLYVLSLANSEDTKTSFIGNEASKNVSVQVTPK